MHALSHPQFGLIDLSDTFDIVNHLHSTLTPHDDVELFERLRLAKVVKPTYRLHTGARVNAALLTYVIVDWFQNNVKSYITVQLQGQKWLLLV